jgi:hypothetical protein
VPWADGRHATLLEMAGPRREVTVAASGQYFYGGETFRSLSEVARQILGVR